ncbi:MAG: type II secretion system F family protein [Bacilli bacterium]|nr:type II secretion system F family protein [Bacilli bacterium]
MKKNKKKKFSHSIFSRKEINKIQKKIDLLGEECDYDAIFFLNLRLYSSIVLFLVVLYVFELGYFLAPIFTFVYYHLIYYIMIESNIKKRCDKLDIEAMYFFEIMALALESGNNLKNALEISCNNVDNDLSKEFKKVLSEVEFGKGLNESLVSLKKRIPSDTINNIILMITQSNTFGNNITKDMYHQIDYIRDKEIQKAKARISKIPLRVSVISVLFYIPLILLLILSPVLLEFLG